MFINLTFLGWLATGSVFVNHGQKKFRFRPRPDQLNQTVSNSEQIYHEKEQAQGDR